MSNIKIFSTKNRAFLFQDDFKYQTLYWDWSKFDRYFQLRKLPLMEICWNLMVNQSRDFMNHQIRHKPLFMENYWNIVNQSKSNLK